MVDSELHGRLLLVVGRFPWPARRGDQMRAVQAAAALAGGGRRVTLLAPEPPAGASVPADLAYRVETWRPSRLASLAGAVRAGLRGLPLQAGLFHQPDLGRRLRELAPGHDAALLQLVRLAAHFDDLGETPFAVDLVDSLSLNFSRRARFDAAWKRPLLAVEARALLAAEGRLLRRATVGLLVCDRDRRWLAERLPREVAEPLRVVPLEVAPPRGMSRDRPTPVAEGRASTAAEAPAETVPPGAGDDSGPLLVVTGNLGYFPTVDAVSWWVGEVWPALRRQRPELRLRLAGSRPAAAVRRAARRPGVELVESPPDLAPHLAAAAVALAPMRAGSGVPVKVLEAWAAGVPVVASRWAAAGADAEDDVELLVADTPEEWRGAILRLLGDPSLAARLSAAGRRRVEAEHAPAAVAAAWRSALAPLFPT